MARCRNLKPGFFKNEDLAECSAMARLCFAGLWTLADREGRLEDRPKRIRGELFAFEDSVAMDRLLAELERHEFIMRYKAAGLGIIQIVEFPKHQNPHHREPQSVLPSPESLGLLRHSVNAKPGAQCACEEDEAQGEAEALEPIGDLPTTPSRGEDDLGTTPSRAEPGALVPEQGLGAIPLQGIPRAQPSAEPLPNGHRKKSEIPDCPHREILALWREVLPAMPQHDPEQWHATRQEHMRTRWRETAVAKHWETQADGLAYLHKLFAYVGRSAFLTGRAKPNPATGKSFTVELSWLVLPENWAKTIEGKYHPEEVT